MADPRLRMVLERLRGMVRPAETAGLADADLLERWVSRRDQAAFELLLWRHGPMVFSVCRRLLRQPQDVEDAFQATFLVLLQKARSISKREAVGSWLYKVAFRVALRARASAARQALGTERDVDVPAVQEPDELLWRDVRTALDEEVNRLPERYRAPFVLCYLEGKTNEEAAREMGLPTGTILSRLGRARERLRARLTRRGLTLSAGLLSAALAQDAASASVPAALVESTMKAVLLGAAEQAVAAGALSAQATALTKGVLHAMWVTKIKTTAAAVLTVAALGGGSVLTYRTLAGGPGDTPAQTTRPQARTARADPAPEDKLKQENEELKRQLARTNAQLEELADRVRVLEKDLQKALRQQPPGAGRPPATSGTLPGPTVRDALEARSLEAAQDEVELLQAQLAVKEAQVHAASLTLQAAEKKYARIGRLAKTGAASSETVAQAEEEVAKLRAELQIKEAELREPAVRLKQARRRLAKLQPQEKEKRAPNPGRETREQQLRELQTKFETLRREMEQLRRQMPAPAERRP